MISAAEFLKWCNVFGVQTGGGGGGSGTVTSITAGAGLTGGTITVSGTIALLVPTIAPVLVASEFNLNATYANGTAGVGATLTNAGTLAALVLDGVTLSVGNRIIVVGQTSAFQNGLYQVTVAGNGSTAWVITRTADFNQIAEMTVGLNVTVSSGDNLAGSIYVLTNPAPVTIGTDDIVFVSMLETANAIIDAYLPLSGGTLTGALVLAADAVAPLEAVTLQQLESVAGITPASIQNQAFTFSNDSGADGTEYIGTYSPVIASYTNGMKFILNPNHTSTTVNPTFDAGAGAHPIVCAGGGANLPIGAIRSQYPIVLTYSDDDIVFQLDYSVASGNVALLQTNTAFNTVDDTGVANAYVATNPFYPDLAAVQGNAAGIVFLKVSNANTGDSTFNYSNTGDNQIQTLDANPLEAGMMQDNGYAILAFNTSGNIWQLLNPWTTGGGGSVTPANIQDQDFIFQGGISNTGNDYTITLSPPLASLQLGQSISFTVNSANTNVVQNQFITLDADGGGAVNVFTTGIGSLVPLYANALIPDGIYRATYQGSLWLLENASTLVDAFALVQQLWIRGDTTGSTTDNLVLTVPQSVTNILGNFIAGAKFTFQSPFTNVGSPLVTINGIGPVGITLDPGLAGGGFPAGTMQMGGIYEISVQDNGGAFQLLNPNPQVIGVNPANIQNMAYTQAPDTGADGTEYIAGYFPVVSSPVIGMILTVQPSHTNSIINPTFDCGSGADPITLKNSLPLGIGDITANEPIQLQRSPFSTWFLLNPWSAITATYLSARNQVNFIGDTSGVANVYVGDNQFYPDMTAIGLNGAQVTFQPAATNTGASTFNYSSTGAFDIILNDGTDITAGMMHQSWFYTLQYNGASKWVLLNPTIVPTVTRLLKSDGTTNANSGSAVVISGMDFQPLPSRTYLLEALLTVTPQDILSTTSFGLTDGAIITSDITLVSGQVSQWFYNAGVPQQQISNYTNQSYGIDQSLGFGAPGVLTTKQVQISIVFTTDATPGVCQLWLAATEASGTDVENGSLCTYTLLN